MAPPGPDRLYEIAYDEAVRALAEQQAIVESLRNRAGLLLSAATVTTSFLGARALDSGRLDPVAWLAVASFVGVAILSLIVLWPRPWEFVADPATVISAFVEAENPAPVGELHRCLSLQLHRSYVENDLGLNRLATYSQLAISLLTFEVVLWVIAIASNA